MGNVDLVQISANLCLSQCTFESSLVGMAVWSVKKKKGGGGNITPANVLAGKLA